MHPRPLALVRSVPDAFARALAGGTPSGTLDPGLALRQHAGYSSALAAGGFAVVEVPGDEAHPDSPFIEDVAVVVGSRALATIPGHQTRRGEVEPVAETLRRFVPVERMVDPARLDGGDVLAVGRTLFVGRSGRTNADGIDALARFAAPLGYTVVPVAVRGALHLKSAMTALDDDLLLAVPGAVDAAVFEGFEILAAEGTGGANVVRLPDGSILIPADRPRTARRLAARGFRTVPVDVSEFARADGGLTCLSVRLRSVLVRGTL